MNQSLATRIPGTEGGDGPFFSPDGLWIGFFAQAEGKLKKVPVDGGTPLNICDVSGSDYGGNWTPNDVILFHTDFEGLQRVPASGGDPEYFTTVDPERGEWIHAWPEELPGGQAVIFTIAPAGSWESAKVGLFLKETGEHRILIDRATCAKYVATGHILFFRSGALHAVPFDLDELELTGSPVPLVEDVIADPATGVVQFAVSENGTLVYVGSSSGDVRRNLLSVAPDGPTEILREFPLRIGEPRISPDGLSLSLTVNDNLSNSAFRTELQRDVWSPLIPEGNSNSVVWSPDGKYVAYGHSDEDGNWNLYWQPVDRSRPAERLTTSVNLQLPTSWSPDGRFLAYMEIGPTTGWDLWILPMEGERTPEAFLQTPFFESGAVFSPDGRWIAYVSNESGRSQVYVKPHHDPGGVLQVSTGGGRTPLWSPDGRQIFYRSGNQMLSVEITTEPSLSASVPRVLFEGNYRRSDINSSLRNYDVMPDGQGFAMINYGVEAYESRQVGVVLNWFENHPEN
jgi:serine/threonine-protein kinase